MYYLYSIKQTQMIINLYKVTPLVDRTLRMSINMITERNDSDRTLLGLHIFTLISLMDETERSSFIGISAKIGLVFGPDNENEVRYNDSLEDTCSVFEYDSEKEVVGMMMWSKSEKSLLEFIKSVKKKFDPENEIVIERNDDGKWSWSDNGYTFEFSSEFKAYADAIGYMKSLEGVMDYCHNK